MLLITGASGFIGKNLVTALPAGQRVRVVVRPTTDLTFLQRQPVEVVCADLETGRGLESALRDVQTVIHCAARTYGNCYREYYESNVRVTRNLIAAMEQTGVARLLFLSSQAVCSNSDVTRPVTEASPPAPRSWYGRSKHEAELAVSTSNLSHVIVRPSMVYGPHDREFVKCVRLIKQGICPVVGSPDKLVNMIHVSDLVAFIITLALKPQWTNATYFVHDGRCYRYTEVITAVSRALGRRSCPIVPVPFPAAYLFGWINEHLPEGRRMVNRDKIREMNCRAWVCSAERAFRDLGFRPRVDLGSGIASTVAWYRAQKWL